MKKFMYTHILCFLLIEVSSRKYDLESEALKLHGEDFNTVLKRFRKTPEYLSILDGKLNDLHEHNDHILILTMHHYIEKLKKKISDIIGLESDRTESSTSTIDPATSYIRGFKYRRQEQEDSEESLTPVQRLDSYYHLSSPLTVAERNSFMDLGFEYAGHIIHMLIKSMGPEDGPVRSTLLPYGGDHYHHNKISTTTEHVHVHEVKSTDLATVTDSTDSTTTPMFRYRYKPSRP